MGWLFGKRKKKKSLAAPIKNSSSGQSLNLNEDSMRDKVIRPDHIKAAAGVNSLDDSGLGSPMSMSNSDFGTIPSSDNPFKKSSKLSDSYPSLGSSSSKNPFEDNSLSNSMGNKPLGALSMKSTSDFGQAESRPAPIRELGTSQPVLQKSDGKVFIKVQQYKRLLGEMKGIDQQISSLSKLTKKLEIAEYNEEKNFLKLKDSIKKIHDKLLTVDRKVFS